MGGGGIENLRWHVPTRPGDTLRGRVVIEAVERLRSRGDRGRIRQRGEMLNQRGELAMSLESVGFVACREPV
jgi:acyl dehydratase